MDNKSLFEGDVNICLSDYSPSILTLMIIRENKSTDQFPTPKHQN